MKTASLPILALAAVIGALSAFPISATAACLAFTAAGLLCIVLADYGRPAPARLAA